MPSVPHLRQNRIRRLFQLGAILEGVGHFLAQHTVGKVDGIKGDGPQFLRVDGSILIQHRLISAHIDDFSHQTALSGL